MSHLCRSLGVACRKQTSQNAVKPKFVAYLDREATPRLRGTGRASTEDPGPIVAPWARTLRASGPSANRHAGTNDPRLLFLSCTPPQVRQNRIPACRQRRLELVGLQYGCSKSPKSDRSHFTAHFTFYLQTCAFLEWSRGDSNPWPPPCKGAKGFSGASWCVRVRGLDTLISTDRRGRNSAYVRLRPGGVAARLLHG